VRKILGDRGGVLIRTEYGFVYLYTHWRAYKLISDVQKGLKSLYRERQGMWGDKIIVYIFAEMIKDVDLETGGYSIEAFHDIKIDDITGEHMGDVRLLIVIDGSKILIKDYDGNVLINTDLKDFMLSDYSRLE